MFCLSAGKKFKLVLSVSFCFVLVCFEQLHLTAAAAAEAANLTPFSKTAKKLELIAAETKIV